MMKLYNLELQVVRKALTKTIPNSKITTPEAIVNNEETINSKNPSHLFSSVLHSVQCKKISSLNQFPKGWFEIGLWEI